jgi:hypothetical protein
MGQLGLVGTVGLGWLPSSRMCACQACTAVHSRGSSHWVYGPDLCTAWQVGEDVLGEALLVGLDAAQPVIEAQQELATLAGRGKRVALLAGPSPRAEQEVKVGW